MQTNGFKNRVIMITGAASGFGKLLAGQLADLGARLILGDLNQVALTEVAAALQAKGADVLALPCDVTCETDVRTLVEAGVHAARHLSLHGATMPTIPPVYKRYLWC